jgi:hypothetical protein
MFQILDVSFTSDSDSNDDDDANANGRTYRPKVNFDFGGEEFRIRFRLSLEAAQWLFERIGHRLTPLRGVGVRADDLTEKQKLLIGLK